MKRKFSKIKIISGPFQPLRKLHLDEGSPDLPHPRASETEPFATHPLIGQWLSCMQVLASKLGPPAFSSARLAWSENLAIRFLQPLLSLLLWTLNQIPNVPLEFPIHARRNFLPVPQIQRDKDVIQLQTAKPFVLPSSLSFTMLERGTTMELVKWP